MIPRYHRNTISLALFMFAMCVSCCQASQQRDAPAFFGINKGNKNNNAKPVEMVDKVHAVRGGNIHLKPWGFLHDIQEDLLFWSQSSAHDITEQPEHRCSRQDVVHECVINYGSTMLGRF